MALTGTLGTPQAQPGNVQPGYSFTSTAVYRGPGGGHIVAIYPNVTQQGVQPDTAFTITPAVASQLAAADSWWVFH